MSWSAQQYLAFEDERTRPVRDLLAAVARPIDTVRAAIDIGCGPGNSTEVLAQRFRGAVISGIDTSPDMIDAARRRLPGVQFALTSIERFVADEVAGDSNDRSYDVILANAVLQWVPDHAALIPALLGKLSMGGALAVQMPDNLDEPAHVLMREVAGAGPWADQLARATRTGPGTTRTAIATADWYYARVRDAGGRADVWRTTYHHPLHGGASAIVEWFQGSGLRPYLAPLASAERAEFLARYEAAVARAYPALADGTVLLPFPRLFIVAVR
jgi:trans-aconitate 2-methyltransferase